MFRIIFDCPKWCKNRTKLKVGISLLTFFNRALLYCYSLLTDGDRESPQASVSPVHTTSSFSCDKKFLIKHPGHPDLVEEHRLESSTFWPQLKNDDDPWLHGWKGYCHGICSIDTSVPGAILTSSATSSLLSAKSSSLLHLTLLLLDNLPHANVFDENNLTLTRCARTTHFGHQAKIICSLSCQVLTSQFVQSIRHRVYKVFSFQLQRMRTQVMGGAIACPPTPHLFCTICKLGWCQHTF